MVFIEETRATKARAKRIVIEVPEALRVPTGKLGERLRIELALRLYERGIASLGQARRIAGSSKRGFLELLAEERVPIYHSEEEPGGSGGCRETCKGNEKITRKLSLDITAVVGFMKNGYEC